MQHASLRAFSWFIATLGFVFAIVFAGCNSDGGDIFNIPYDGGGDAANEGGDGSLGEVDPTLGGPCTEDGQCDDRIECTFDRCDKTLSRCRNTPDDTLCADQEYCNGKERCVLRKGCAPGPVVTCQDDNGCTIDRCVEATRACERAPRDVDGDGDPDDHCAADRDCDDLDPMVSSKRSEICNNFKDDNCNGAVDEQPCAEAANDVCATALPITAAGTYLLTSVAAKKDYATTCTVERPTASRDVVVAITVPAGDARDVLVTAETSAPANEVAVALQSTCGKSATEIGCGHTAFAPEARAIARSQAAGATIYAVVTTQGESALDVRVEFLPATSAPTNETCAAPRPVALETPFTVSLIDAKKDLVTGCDRARTGELTYSFTLPTASDVRIFASTLTGSGRPVVSIRDAGCTNELRCRVGSTPPAFARSLPAGPHVFSIAGTTQLDASVLVKTYPPTTAPPNQSCATAPDVVRNQPFTVDLSAQEDAIQNGCLSGGPSAAYKLDLTETSDVLVIGRFPANEIGAVSINAASCTPGGVIACTPSATPARASKRALPPGSYRIVVADELGQTAQVMVLVRPTAAPTAVTASNGCADTITIPASGGFFTGDTTSMTGDFNASCDAPGQPIGSANDQLLRLDLPESRRVVFDMSGSFLTTILDLRQGAVCPGSEITDACHVGTGPNRSFLDRTLGAGTHWIQIDGFNGEIGEWNLDVRVLPP